MTDYTILIVGYLLIATITLWFFIKTKGWIWNRLIIVALVVGYGISMLYTVPTLMGWPIEAQIIPEQTIVSYIIKEPTSDNPGYICFWTIKGNGQPRSYKIPYSKKTHKKLLEARKKAGRGGVILIQREKGKIKKKGKGNPKGTSPGKADGIRFKILSPTQILPKDPR